jgi:hypothetical protein
VTAAAPKLLEPDRRQIERFFDALFRHSGNEGFISFRSFYHNNKPLLIEAVPVKSGFKYLCDVAEDHARRAANAINPAVFCPPIALFANKDHAGETDLLAGPALSVECDERPDEARDKLEQVLGPATLVVYSGGKWTAPDGKLQDKLHLHWRLTRPARGNDLAKLKRARRLAVQLAGGDASNVPTVHPIRWPGSWHRKGEPVLCGMATLEPDREIELDAAVAALEAALPGKDRKGNGFDHDAGQYGNDAGDTERPDWAALTQNIVAGKDLHDSTMRLAASYVGSGMTAAVALRMLQALMLASSAPHDERWQARFADLARLVKDGQAKYGNKGTEQKVEVLWHGQVDYRDSRPQLVQDVIPEIGHGLIAGQWGTFKTFGAFDLAHSCMSGEPWLGYEIMRRGGVLFIALEGAAEVPIRLQGVIEHRGKIEDLAPFAWTETCPPLIGKNAADEICAIAEPIAKQFDERFGVPLVLIIVDTVIAGAGYQKDGAENDAAAGQAVMNSLKAVAKRIGCFVFGIDHFGKAIETGTRGTSAKEGSADVVIAMLGDKSISGEVTNTRLALRKRRGGPNGEEHPFTVRVVPMGVDNRGKPMSTLVLDWRAAQDTSAAAKDRWTKSLRLLRQVLMTILADNGSNRRPYADGPTVRAVDIELVRREFYRQHLADGDEKQKADARRQAFNRAVKGAQDAGLVAAREVDGMQLVWLTKPETA